jgi:hypothetical protein
MWNKIQEQYCKVRIKMVYRLLVLVSQIALQVLVHQVNAKRICIVDCFRYAVIKLNVIKLL